LIANVENASNQQKTAAKTAGTAAAERQCFEKPFKKT
jgi:hypothetical protein